MAPAKPKRTEQPPLVDLDDRGARWRQHGPSLLIERGPSVGAVAMPSLVFVLLVAMAYVAYADGDMRMVVFFSLTLLLPIGLGLARIMTRYQVEVDGSAVRWSGVRPLRCHGQWPRSDVSGLRYWIDPETPSWLSRRRSEVLLKVRGRWVVLASGYSKRRGRALVDAIALATGFAPDLAGHANPGGSIEEAA